MENALKNVLEENERVLWFGRPAKSKLLQAPDRNYQIGMWAILAGTLAVSFGVFIPYMLRLSQPVSVMAVVVLILNAVPILVATRPWLDQRLVENKTICAITDRRVISVVKEEVHALSRDGLDWEITNRDGAAGSIRFGAAVGTNKRGERADAVLGIREDDGRFGMIFYHIDQVDDVADLLQPSLQKDAA